MEAGDVPIPAQLLSYASQLNRSPTCHALFNRSIRTTLREIKMSLFDKTVRKTDAAEVSNEAVCRLKNKCQTVKPPTRRHSSDKAKESTRPQGNRSQDSSPWKSRLNHLSFEIMDCTRVHPGLRVQEMREIRHVLL